MIKILYLKWKIFYLEIILEDSKEYLEEMYIWESSILKRQIQRNYIRRITKIINTFKNKQNEKYINIYSNYYNNFM